MTHASKNTTISAISQKIVHVFCQFSIIYIKYSHTSNDYGIIAVSATFSKPTTNAKGVGSEHTVNALDALKCLGKEATRENSMIFMKNCEIVIVNIEKIVKIVRIL
jgi:hypothetical protein